MPRNGADLNYWWDRLHYWTSIHFRIPDRGHRPVHFLDRTDIDRGPGETNDELHVGEIYGTA